MQRMLVIIVALVLVLAGSFAITSCQKVFESPSDVVRSFFDAIEQGKYAKARSYVHLAVREQFTLEEFDSAREFFARRRGIKRIDIVNESIRGELAEVSYTVHFKDGTSEKGTFFLEKEEGKWKIVR